MDVGFVGAGQLGLPMVERLLAAGHSVHVYARRPEVRSVLQQAGAHVVHSPREAAAQAQLLILCPFSDAQLVEVCEGPHGALAGLRGGCVMASHVTGTRATLLGLRAQAHPDAEVVDAPVSGTAEDIRVGRLTVLLGGAPPAVARCSEVMSAYAGTVLPVGELGAALAVKLVNNLLFAAHSQLAVAAVELAGSFGVDRGTLLAALQSCSGASRAVAILSGVPDDAAFNQHAGPFLRKDVAACLAELVASGGDAALLLQTVQHGPLDLTA